MNKPKMKPYKRSKWGIIARQIALEAFRNTKLEELHGGTPLPKKYRRGYSRINDVEMRELMLEIESTLRISLWVWDKKKNDKEFIAQIEHSLFDNGISWDLPNKKCM